MDTILEYPEGYIVPLFQWNDKKRSGKLALSDEDLKCKAIDGSGFKSVLGNMVRISQYHAVHARLAILFRVAYRQGESHKDWRFDGKCERRRGYQPSRIGQAFSDTDRGWAIYNGELRHNSNSSGAKYGQGYKQGDVIGVYLDMIEGTLSFSKNKQFWGLAFRDDKLKTETLYAAVAPIYKEDGCTLNMSIKED